MGRARTINENETPKGVTLETMSALNKAGGCGKPCGKAYLPASVADYRAQVLIDKFDAPQCRLFFLRCIYHLPEATIEGIVEMSMRKSVKSHIRYFTVVAKRELARIGY